MLFVNRNTGPLKFRQRLKKILWIPKELFKDKYNIYLLIHGQVFTNWAMNIHQSLVACGTWTYSIERGYPHASLYLFSFV